MQATFELSGEILERLRREAERCGRPMSALVEAALQTALPAPAEAPEANAAPDEAESATDGAAQPRPPRNLPSWDLGKPLVDFSNRDELYRDLDDEKYWRFSNSPEPASEESVPESSAPPPDAAAQPRPPLNLPSWSCGKPFVDVNNRDELYRALDDDEYFAELYGFRLNPDTEATEGTDDSEAVPDAADPPRKRLKLPSWDMGEPTVDVSNREELERALYDDEKFRRRYGFSLYPDTEEKE